MGANSKSVIAIALLVAMVTTLSLCSAQKHCEPQPEGYDIEDMHTFEYWMKLSDVVFIGNPLSRTESVDTPGAFDYKFEIRCIYKGGRKPEMVTIRDVGMPPVTCVPMNLVVNAPATVFLKQISETVYTPLYPNESGDDGFSDELRSLCETKVVYPKGVTEPKQVCKAVYTDEACIPPPTQTPEVVIKQGNSSTENSNDKTTPGKGDDTTTSAMTGKGDGGKGMVDKTDGKSTDGMGEENSDNGSDKSTSGEGKVDSKDDDKTKVDSSKDGDDGNGSARVTWLCLGQTVLSVFFLFFLVL